MYGQRSFDVAAVHMEPTVPSSFNESPTRSGGKITWTTTLAFLVGYGYHVHEWQLEGVAREATFYKIQASFDEAATDADVRTMLRGLLAERFHLVTHLRTDERSGFDLVLSKKGAKFTTSTNDPKMGSPGFAGKLFFGILDQGTFGLSGHAVPLSKLTEQLSDLLRTLVRDRTGMTGNYCFNLKFQRPDATGEVGSDSDAPTVFNALEAELGLKLEKSKGSTEILVVDRIDKTPVEN